MKFAPIMLSAVLALTACSDQEAEEAVAQDSSTNGPPTGNPLTAPTDYLGAVAKGQNKATLTINLASVQQAVNLYQAAEGRYPATLEQLVQEGYLASVPPAPSGQRLAYNPADGTIALEPIPSE